MSTNIKTRTWRSPNVVNANPQRIGSSDLVGRYATGRSVKMAWNNHTYKIVELWRLKERVVSKKQAQAARENDRGVVAIVERGQTLSRIEAENWVSNGVLPT